MRFKCADREKKKEEKFQEKIQSHIDQHNYLLNWHPWFAWYPVRLDGDCVWLEKVWRRFNDYDDHFAEYSNVEYMEFGNLVGERRHFESKFERYDVPIFPDVTNGEIDEY